MSILSRFFGTMPESEIPPAWAIEILHSLRSIEHLARVILSGVNKMDRTMDDLLSDITSEKTQVDSLVALTGSLKTQLTNVLANVSLPAGVQDKINAAFDAVEANKASIMNGINANTPAAAVNPTATAEPAPAA